MDDIIQKLFEQDKKAEIQKTQDKITGNSEHPTKIWALGGIDEIGKNMYVFQQGDEIFIVDCGIKFADEDLPGVGGIICPFEALLEEKDKIKGLIITHAHEDHIGGIPYLLMTLDIPKIYGAQLSIEFIKKRLKEFPEIKFNNYEVINDKTVIKTEEFKIEFYRVCHSIPDAFGIYFETKNAKIIESGDFKFDFAASGDEFDILKAAELGRRDVDVLMCESTNSETPGFGASEKYVIEELRNLIEYAPGRVFVSTFASNLQRIEEIIQLGLKMNRKICLFGRSMNANVQIAINLGLLNVSKQQIIDSADLNKYPDNEIMILCTGSQGEEMAALNQMAIGRNQRVVFKKTDTVILSSNPIPGNYENVENLINKLYIAGVNVCVNTKESKIHSSGHATQVEQQLLIKLVNPQYIIPIHGEFKMLRALRQNAIDAGVHPDNIVQVSKGQVVEILNHKIISTEKFVDIFDVYVNNGKIDYDSTSTLKYRKVLSKDGIVNVTLVLNYKTMQLLMQPTITTKGTFFVKDSQALLGKISYAIKDKLTAFLKKSKFINNNYVRKLVSSTVQFYVWSNKRKNPIVRTTIFELNDEAKA
ncbi:MAG: ribonuclease J [Malacoplasma sp.]|nr:ribonuclease J [Malacoplasma sp.]